MSWIGPIGFVADGGIRCDVLTLDYDVAAAWLRPGDVLYLAPGLDSSARSGHLVVEEVGATWCRTTLFVTSGIPSAASGDVVILWGRRFCAECGLPFEGSGALCGDLRCAWNARLRALAANPPSILPTP